MRILIKGFYGWQNFGDDLLLLCSTRLLRQLFPNANLTIWVAGPNADYVPQLVGDNVEVIKPTRGDRSKFDLIVFGGGGLFFDFHDGGLMSHMRNNFIRTVGYRAYVTACSRYKAILRKAELQSGKQWGWGIGVGGYTQSSKRYHGDIQLLGRFSRLMVRDEQSFQNATILRSQSGLELGTDLVFDRTLWSSETLVQKREDHFGLVLCNHSQVHLDAMKELGERLKSDGKRIKIFSFCAPRDGSVLAHFAEDFPILQWEPRQGISEFLSALGAQKCLVTSRAHGAIVGACIGVPSVIVDIDSKLRSVHQMLPRSSRLLSVFCSIEQYKETLEMVSNQSPLHLQEDLADNLKVIQRMRRRFREWAENAQTS